jgi:hypothetical protein
MKDVVKFYGHLLYFAVNWHIFPSFGRYVESRKIWQEEFQNVFETAF